MRRDRRIKTEGLPVLPEAPLYWRWSKLNQPNRTGRLAVCLFLYIPVVWATLLLAQSLDGGGLLGILASLTAALENPFAVRWTDRSLMCILICSALYAAALCYASANRGRTRRAPNTAPPPGAAPSRSTPCLPRKKTSCSPATSVWGWIPTGTDAL